METLLAVVGEGRHRRISAIYLVGHMVTQKTQNSEPPQVDKGYENILVYIIQ
jgi:hypothetical protein